MPWAVRKYLKAETGRLLLRMPGDEDEAFGLTSEKISKTVETILILPVLPREVEDILAISSRERHKWLKDGRLESIGTRTVNMRGRSKVVIFHVFDPKHIEEVLDRDLLNSWRDQDAEEVARNRRRGTNKAARTRAGILKQTGSYEQASYAIQDTPDVVQQHYGRFLPQDKAALAARILNQVWEAA